MKNTIDAMQRGLGRAVMDLRAGMGWGQTDLAHEIAKTAARLMIICLKPTQVCVSRWETGDSAPSQQYRMVLARIAAKDKKTAHLVELFCAPVSAWRLVGLCRKRDGEDAA